MAIETTKDVLADNSGYTIKTPLEIGYSYPQDGNGRD